MFPWAGSHPPMQTILVTLPCQHSHTPARTVPVRHIMGCSPLERLQELSNCLAGLQPLRPCRGSALTPPASQRPLGLFTHFPALSAGLSSLSPAGIHTAQAHVGCALSNQAPVDPRFQFAFDGRDFISFDNQTGTWVAAVQPAFLQKQRWETVKTWTQYVQRYLQYEAMGDSHTVSPPVPPEVSVSRRDASDSSVTLSCRARGFYPRPIHVSWVRDGEDILVETDSSGILPNTDGTYYTQSSLEISPQQDRHRYACRVKHSSLGEPVLVWVGRLPPWRGGSQTHPTPPRPSPGP
uniref:Ig-like domain-containing protein n=1 Tax=Chrysemys picta bellii TaxID=8478 RepID=A0A8C3H750_CHRPI